MKTFKNQNQKNNIAKASYDIFKIIFGIAILTPVVKNEFNIYILVFGMFFVLAFLFIGYYLDGKEVKK